MIDKIIEFFKSIRGTRDIPSPQNWIPKDNIKIVNSAGTLTINDLPYPSFAIQVADTKSMDGALDSNHTVIITSNPEYLDRADIGDVVIYDIKVKMIIHQIVSKGEDEKGEYFKCKGWNNASVDSYKVRREDIKYVSLSIIW